MKFACYADRDQQRVGVVSDDQRSIAPLRLSDADAARGVLPLVEALSRGEALPPAEDAPVPLASVRLLAPFPRPRRNLFCVGRNYHAHASELKGSVFNDDGKPVDQWPIVFTKVPECVIGPGDTVKLPGAGITEQIDYEAELTVVIGTGGKNIRREDAMRHIAGYTIVNDVTARDVQMRHSQWDLGKSFDTFCPMGPWMVTADVFDGRRTRVRCWVNDELRQDGATELMIFDIPTLIETVSRGITLYPGDLIATGTPAGVGMGLNPPRWLQPGDRVRIEIDDLGTLENPIA